MDKRTILCVDDEQSILNALGRLLRREDYTVLTASNAKEGLKLTQENQIDLIISDQRMPGMTGVDLLKQVKEISPNTVRIILSGYTDVNSITAAINEGNVYKFILKPWNDDELGLTIKRALEQYDLLRENERLYEKIKKQNEELRIFNEELEQKVREKAEEILFKDEVLVFSQDFVKNLPIGLVGIGEGELIALVNKRAQAVFGNNIESFLTSKIDEFFSDDILCMIRDVLKIKQPRTLHNVPYDGKRLCIECTPMESFTPGLGVVLIVHEAQKDASALK
ncbi:MAG: response regulator [Pseudomonadota bacterium]